MYRTSSPSYYVDLNLSCYGFHIDHPNFSNALSYF